MEQVKRQVPQSPTQHLWSTIQATPSELGQTPGWPMPHPRGPNQHLWSHYASLITWTLTNPFPPGGPKQLLSHFAGLIPGSLPNPFPPRPGLTRSPDPCSTSIGHFENGEKFPSMTDFMYISAAKFKICTTHRHK